MANRYTFDSSKNIYGAEILELENSLTLTWSDTSFQAHTTGTNPEDVVWATTLQSYALEGRLIYVNFIVEDTDNSQIFHYFAPLVTVAPESIYYDNYFCMQFGGQSSYGTETNFYLTIFVLEDNDEYDGYGNASDYYFTGSQTLINGYVTFRPTSFTPKITFHII